MKPDELKKRLRGVIAFTVTPFREGGALDEAGLEVLVRRLSRSGVEAVACAGEVGEFYALSAEEYRTVIRATVRAAERRVPVLVGTGHHTLAACELARFAEAEGADGLLVHPYFVPVELDGLRRHHEALARASALGQIVFGNPQCVYTPEALESLAEIESVVGLKDEVGDLPTFERAVARLGDRLAWLNGMGEMLAADYFTRGAVGFTTGLANLDPRIPLALWNAAERCDGAALADVVARKVSRLAALRTRRKGYGIAAIKEGMRLLGLPAGPCRLPLTGLDAGDRDELRQILTDLRLII